MGEHRVLGRLIEMSAEEFNRLLETEAADIIEDYIREDVERSARTWKYARLEAVRGYQYHI